MRLEVLGSGGARSGIGRVAAAFQLVRCEPPGELRGVDLAVLPMGICVFDPFTGERRIPAGHPVLRLEATLPQTLAVVERVGARRVVLAHVEEIDGLSHDRLQELGRRHGVEFAHDMMVADV